MTKILHNPRCQKSRQTLKILEEHGENYDVIEYLKEPPSREELLAIIHMLGITPIQLIRKGEKDYTDNLKGKDLSDEALIDAMLQYPKLIERPIVIKDGKAIIGRPPEGVLTIL